MKTYFLLLPLLIMIATAHGQDSLSTNDKNLMQILNMELQDYKAFANTIKDYHQKLLNVQKDKTLSFGDKKKAIKSLHQQKQNYITNHLSQDQQNKLNDYYKTNAHHSQAYLKRQQQMETLRQSSSKQSTSQ